MVSTRVSEDQEARLTERSLKLVGKCTRSVPSSNGMSSSVLCKLQNSSLTIWSSRLNNDILGVLNCHNNPGSHLKLLPCLCKVDDVNSCKSVIQKAIYKLRIFVQASVATICIQQYPVHSYRAKEQTMKSIRLLEAFIIFCNSSLKFLRWTENPSTNCSIYTRHQYSRKAYV